MKKFIWFISAWLCFGGLSGMMPVQAREAAKSPALVAAAGTGTRFTLDSCLALLGKNDQEAQQFFGGGRETYDASGRTVIGRVYPVRVFSENRQAGTLYDADGRVMSIIIRPEEAAASRYLPVLKRLYGSPAREQKVPGEGGATYQEWRFPGAILRLYQEYGGTAIEFDRLQVHPFSAGVRPRKRTDRLQLTDITKKPFPELEKAAAAYYGLSEEALAKTEIRYAWIDLNHDSNHEVIAVLSGPYTSGTGGSSLLIGQMENGQLRIWQALTLVRTPFVVEQGQYKVLGKATGTVRGLVVE